MKVVLPNENSKLMSNVGRRLPFRIRIINGKRGLVFLAIGLLIYLAGLMVGNEPYEPPVLAVETVSIESTATVEPQPTVPAALAYPTEEHFSPQSGLEYVQPTAVPDPYDKYIGQPVPHPRREPDRLVTVKISRYDPALGGTNCFRWANGTCASPLANGEDWKTNYEIAIACPFVFPFGTIIEIDGWLWECKDRGGKIVQNRPDVYWVDQLSRTGHFPFGTEMLASVWFPQ